MIGYEQRGAYRKGEERGGVNWIGEERRTRRGEGVRVEERGRRGRGEESVIDWVQGLHGACHSKLLHWKGYE